LNVGLEIMGLHLSADDFARSLYKSEKPNNVVSAGLASEDDIDDMDEKTPFNYEAAFEFAVKHLSNKLGKVQNY
jgi:hypothetical protein